MVTRPTPQCRVKLRTKGQLENGTVVDKHHAVSFTLGDGDVIQGGGGCGGPCLMQEIYHEL